MADWAAVGMGFILAKVGRAELECCMCMKVRGWDDSCCISRIRAFSFDATADLYERCEIHRFLATSKSTQPHQSYFSFLPCYPNNPTQMPDPQTTQDLQNYVSSPSPFSSRTRPFFPFFLLGILKLSLVIHILDAFIPSFDFLEQTWRPNPSF